VIRGDVAVAIEVTTSNPSQDADEDDAALSTSARIGVPDDLPASQRDFVFQAGKALRRKLLKRDAAGLAYWERSHVAGVPFVIALEPFHAASALFHAVGWLSEYLYGRRDIVAYDARGRLQLTAEQIGQHQHGGKSIPSGLFALPEAAHLSAVLFTNSSTVSKFNRIGTERGYGPPDRVVASRFRHVHGHLTRVARRRPEQLGSPSCGSPPWVVHSSANRPLTAKSVMSQGFGRF
jgi:hypothetical protein